MFNIFTSNSVCCVKSETWRLQFLLDGPDFVHLRI